MTSYPRGVLQNYAPPFAPLDLRPVPETSWKWFAPLEEAEKGLKMIQACASNAFMQWARNGQWSQYIYRRDPPDVAVRIAYGQAKDEKGNEVLIEEFPSDIYDRWVKPQPFIDEIHQESQKPKVLKCRKAAEGLGQLYWTNQY